MVSLHSINKQIESLEESIQNIAKAKEQASRNLERERRYLQGLPPDKRLAELLHRRLCTVYPHDDCGWHYDQTWEEGEHARWLERARRALAVVGGNEALVVALLDAIVGGQGTWPDWQYVRELDRKLERAREELGRLQAERARLQSLAPEERVGEALFGGRWADWERMMWLTRVRKALELAGGDEERAVFMLKALVSKEAG